MTRAVWFHDHGIHVFPVHGKEPAVPKGTSWKDFRCSRQRAAQLRNYAVPLSETLGVLDTDNPEAEAWVRQQIAHRSIPSTPFRVRTARGLHRYFLLAGPLPTFIHRAGHTMEFRNAGQYVVGPGSLHPSGAVYAPVDWSWCWEDIPFFPPDFDFDDRPADARGSDGGQRLVLPEAIFESERHATLHRIMRSLVAHGVPVDGAVNACLIENRERCRPPLADLHELDRYLRRAYNRKDHADFIRAPKTGWDLAGALVSIGLSIEAVLVAVRAVTPDFDPEVSA